MPVSALPGADPLSPFHDFRFARTTCRVFVLMNGRTPLPPPGGQGQCGQAGAAMVVAVFMPRVSHGWVLEREVDRVRAKAHYEVGIRSLRRGRHLAVQPVLVAACVSESDGLLFGPVGPSQK